MSDAIADSARNRTLAREQLGASAAEYSLMLGLIAIVGFGAWAALGDATSEKTACVAAAIGGSGAPCSVEPSSQRLGLSDEGVRAAHTALNAGGRDPEYERAVTSALSSLSSEAGADGRITTAQVAALVQADPRFAPLVGQSLTYALDTASGGDSDGVISRDDIAGITEAVARGELAETLADTGARRGGRDHHASREDYEALAKDGSLPSSVREWSVARADALPEEEEEEGCGWNPVCHVEHAGDDAVHAASDFARDHGGSAVDAVAWSSGLLRTASWMTGVAPPLDPRQWDDWVRFRIDVAIGFGQAAYDTARGLGALARWYFTPGPKEIDLGAVWAGVRAVPAGLWNELEGCAGGDGRACGRLTFDGGTMVVPGGAAVRGARLAGGLSRTSRIARAARDAHGVPQPARSGVPQGYCFRAGTEVHVASGHAPIEQIRIGSRVTTMAATPMQGTAVDASWRHVTLEMPDPSSSADVLTIELLRPATWLDELGVSAGGEIDLTLREMRIRGQARVLSVEPAAPVQEGPGFVVLATIASRSSRVVALRFEGSEVVLEPTASHPLYSLDRAAWVPAGELRPGERLESASGPVVVASVTEVAGTHTVYNLEVESAHTFLVSSLGVLSHNNNPCAAMPKGLPSAGRALDATDEAAIAHAAAQSVDPAAALPKIREEAIGHYDGQHLVPRGMTLDRIGETRAWRVDSRPPEVVFREGFEAGGDHHVLHLHLRNLAQGDYVATTQSFQFAEAYAGNSSGVIYKVFVRDGVAARPNEWDGALSSYRTEAELTAHGGIAPEDVIGYYTRESGRWHFVRNPHTTHESASGELGMISLAN